MCVGDIHNIAEEVVRFDPAYSLELNPRLGKYQVFHCRTRAKYEGDHSGRPLYSFTDVYEVALTVDFIDAEKQPPDMRIIQELRKNDIWNYSGGPGKYYDDMLAEADKVKQKREDDFSDKVKYSANERQKYILKEHEGQKIKTLY